RDDAIPGSDGDRSGAERGDGERNGADSGEQTFHGADYSGTYAIASISTSSPSPGSPATCTVVRAGRWSPNIRAYETFMLGNSWMSTRNTPQRNTCCRLEPAASRIACTFLRHCVVCASTVSPASLPVAGSVAPWPETKINRSNRVLGEYGPRGLGSGIMVSRPDAMDRSTIRSTIRDTASRRADPRARARADCGTPSRRNHNTTRDATGLRLRPCRGPSHGSLRVIGTCRRR